MKKIFGVFCVASLFVAGQVLAADTTHGAATGEYGKHCAWGLTMGKQVATDCKINWSDNNTHKTYCFSSEEAKTSFAKDTNTNIAKATTEYGKITGHHAATGHDTKKM